MVVINGDTSPDASRPEVSVTLKGHRDFDASWIVVRGGSIAEVNAMLQGPVDELIATVLGVDQLFHAAYTAAEGLGAQPVQQKKSWGDRGGNGGQSKPKEQESVGKKEKPADPNQAVLDKINEATSKADVFKIFGDHSTGNLKVNGGWPTPELETAAKTKLGELTEKK